MTEDDAERAMETHAALLDQLDALCGRLLIEYQRHVPVLRQPITLWESLKYINDVLDCWIKFKPAEVTATMLILKHHLRRMEL